jgi:hypothetical protein
MNDVEIGIDEDKVNNNNEVEQHVLLDSVAKLTRTEKMSACTTITWISNTSNLVFQQIANILV